MTMSAVTDRMVRNAEISVLSPNVLRHAAFAVTGNLMKAAGGDSDAIRDLRKKHLDRRDASPRGVAYVESRRNEQRWILRMAAAIEPDAVLLMNWFQGDPITALGGLTAEELVANGAYEELVAFLCAIDRGSSGVCP